MDDTTLAALREMWSDLEGLHITGEQRQRLQYGVPFCNEVSFFYVFGANSVILEMGSSVG